MRRGPGSAHPAASVKPSTTTSRRQAKQDSNLKGTPILISMDASAGDRSRGDGRRRACVPELGDGGAGPEVVLNGLGADDPAGGAVLGLVHQLRRVVPVLRLDLRRAVPHVRTLNAEALDEHLGLSLDLSTERRNGESWLDS
jgi:hypothetical protein